MRRRISNFLQILLFHFFFQFNSQLNNAIIFYFKQKIGVNQTLEKVWYRAFSSTHDTTHDYVRTAKAKLQQQLNLFFLAVTASTISLNNVSSHIPYVCSFLGSNFDAIEDNNWPPNNQNLNWIVSTLFTIEI